MSAAESALEIRREGFVAVIAGGAALDAAFRFQLDDCCAALADDTDVRVILLDPAPPVWTGYADPPEPGNLFASLAELPQPTIAVLSGDTFGGGLELALSADLRVAGRELRLGLPHLLDGAEQFPRSGGLQRLSRAVGRSRATQLVLLEPALDAEQALDWGLVNAVTDDPHAAAIELAQQVAQRGPIATRYAKDAVRHGLEMPLAQALHYETELTILLQDTADRAEGVRAFVEKRPPEFQGVQGV